MNKFSSLLFPKKALKQKNETFKGYLLTEQGIEAKSIEKNNKKKIVSKFINSGLYMLFHYYIDFACKSYFGSNELLVFFCFNIIIYLAVYFKRETKPINYIKHRNG